MTDFDPRDFFRPDDMGWMRQMERQQDEAAAFTDPDGVPEDPVKVAERVAASDHDDLTYLERGLLSVIHTRDRWANGLVKAGNDLANTLAANGWGDDAEENWDEEETGVVQAMSAWYAAVKATSPCERCRVTSGHSVIAALSNLYGRSISHAEAQGIASAVCPTCNPAQLNG